MLMATNPGKQPWQPVERWWRAYDGDQESDAVQKRLVQAIATNRAITRSTQQALKDILDGKLYDEFKSLREKNSKTKLNFIDKLDFTKRTNNLVYFRKMSPLEWADIQEKYEKKPLLAALKFKDADLYRVWLTTSEGMVRKFINEVATTNADVIVKFVMKAPVISNGNCAPHQNTGVQTDKTKIAVHRETFAHIGHFSSADLAEVRTASLDHNISFTLTNAAVFHEAFSHCYEYK
jgi:hypothetical protein